MIRPVAAISRSVPITGVRYAHSSVNLPTVIFSEVCAPPRVQPLPFSFRISLRWAVVSSALR